ncbi:MAG: lipoate--protein ligase family protein [Candidatus Aenigmarchaeota archaeon]|nr:lipoate--protein ligase family protein [Candidatus Aenigmarchaeota archaeon]
MDGVASEKVAGGKLVRVKVNYDNVINSINIYGDFFLHPEDAIEDIERSLIGLKTDVDESLIAGIISEVVEVKGIQLIGITPEAISKAVKKAMVKWRVIPLHVADAFMSMAIDEAVSEAVANGMQPTIRFWRWQPSAVSIGYFQSTNDEVNLDVCRELGVDVVRRRTGGGAVYHDYQGEITYSVIAPEWMFPKGIHESYNLICGWIIAGLKQLGIEAQFVPINDIVVNGKKISGNAQTRRNGVLLQHGTILYDLDVRKMFSLLKVSQEKISDKMIKAVEDRVTRLLNFGNFSLDECYQALLKGFTDGKAWELGKLTDAETKNAEELARNRYRTQEWNFKR